MKGKEPGAGERKMYDEIDTILLSDGQLGLLSEEDYAHCRNRAVSLALADTELFRIATVLRDIAVEKTGMYSNMSRYLLIALKITALVQRNRPSSGGSPEVRC